MKNQEIDILEICWLVILFIFLTIISYYNVEGSISVVKYIFSFGIRNLLENYHLYHQSFKDFIFQTGSFHPGNTDAGWRTIFFLLPLFIFCDFLGGLSLKTMYFFTITSSLIFLVLFYWWVRKSWGRVAAFFATFFLGFSAIFQEIARSGDYHSYSFLIAIVWILYCFNDTNVSKPLYFWVFGLLTGVLWYAYGMARPMSLVALIRIYWLRLISKKLAFCLFIGGMALVLIPGIIVLLEQNKNYHGPWHLFFIDRENIFDYERWDIKRILLLFLDNFRIFLARMIGCQQVMEWQMKWLKLAHFLNPFLVIPMLIGLTRVFTLWKCYQNKLLILIGFMIFLPPMFSSGGCTYEPRRAIFYVIPIYCFIGLGCKEIFYWVKRNLHNMFIKGFILILLTGIVFMILSSEMIFFQQNIVSFKRDLGLLAFVDKVKQMGIGGNIYYLEGRSIYDGASESDIMRLALMGERKKVFDVENGSIKDPLPYISRSFFMVRGLDISDKNFDQWVLRNKLKCNLILESKLINLEKGKKTIDVVVIRKSPKMGESLEIGGSIKISPIRLYAVQRF